MEKRFRSDRIKHYKDIMKAPLRDFNIPTKSREQTLQDRAKWRCLISKGAAQYEAKRVCAATRKRQESEARVKDHHQSRYSRSSLALHVVATDSLELKGARTLLVKNCPEKWLK